MIASQSILFLKFLLAGLLFGVLLGLFKLIKTFLNNKFIIFILDFLTCLLFTILYICLINKYNLGESRLYLITSLMLGSSIERISLGKLFAKIYLKLYNKSKILKSKLLNTKLGKIISK